MAAALSPAVRDSVGTLPSRLARLKALIQQGPQSPAAVTPVMSSCPMPVMRSGPAVDAMPRMLPDTAVAPAFNRTLALTSCHNELFQSGVP
jgi:hypothetical protein